MNAEFITIATYDMPPPAHLALGLLHEAGISALLRNEEIVAGAWDLGQASRGVEVQVPSGDARRARELVEQAKFGGGVDTAGELPGEDGTVDRLTPEQHEDLRVANRALMSAVFGILFGPLQVYSLWLLYGLSLGRRPERRTALVRRRMRAAFLVDLWVVGGTLVLAYIAFGSTFF